MKRGPKRRVVGAKLDLVKVKDLGREGIGEWILTLDCEHEERRPVARPADSLLPGAIFLPAPQAHCSTCASWKPPPSFQGVIGDDWDEAWAIPKDHPSQLGDAARGRR